MWLDDESLVSSSSLQISHVVAQCVVLTRQHPRTGNVAVLLCVHLLHPVVLVGYDLKMPAKH